MSPDTQELEGALLLMRSLLQQERSALEENQADLIQSLAAQKNKLSSKLEALIANKAGVSLWTTEERERLQSLAGEMEREAKINAQIATGALAASIAKLNLIAQLASDSYGPDGKPSGPAGRGSWEARA